MKKAMCAVLFCTIGFALSAANLPGTLSEDGKILWIDGANLPLEGRAFADAEQLLGEQTLADYPLLEERVQSMLADNESRIN